jgi:hypothetical protein
VRPGERGHWRSGARVTAITSRLTVFTITTTATNQLTATAASYAGSLIQLDGYAIASLTLEAAKHTASDGFGGMVTC